jgi:hypothetical protein
MSEPKPKTAKDLYEAAQQLSPDERELLTTMLNQDEAPGFASPDIEAAWLDEVRRRRKLHEQGKTKDVPGEEVFAALQQKYSG